MTEGPRRFPRRVFGEGREPDPRFSLANERTFLAWVRTSLALIAGGVAIDAVPLSLPAVLREVVALLLLLLGLVLPVFAWRHWAATERAMRLAAPLPAASIGLLIAMGTCAAGVVVGVGVLLL